jgi:UDP-GlcNAc:undecaprenyl-phosphate GlcNAc-1-phosphate transferase
VSGLTELLFSLLCAGAAAALASPLVIAAARRWELVDRPGGYKAHREATPLLGGLIVAAGLAASSAWFLPRSDGPDAATFLALAAGSLLVLAVGLVDDLSGMTPRSKFLWQLLATGTTGSGLAAFGVRLDLFLPWPPLPMIALTVLWVVAITNAFNFLDNMNGLCAGLGAIAAVSIALLNWHSGERMVALAAAALAGACLGYLPANWPAARIFLGDTGSMLIGFLLAGLSVVGVYARGAEVPAMAPFAPLLALAVPLLDMVIVVLLRLRARRPPWLGDRRHLNHRLVRRGLRPMTAVLTLWAAGAASGAVAVALPLVDAATGAALIAVLCLCLCALALAAGAEGLARQEP